MTDIAALGRTDDLSLDDGRTATLRLPGEIPTGRAVPAVVLLHPFGVWDRDAFLPAEASGNGPVRLFDDLGAALVRAGLAAAAFDTRFLTEDRRDGAGSPDSRSPVLSTMRSGWSNRHGPTPKWTAAACCCWASRWAPK